MKQGTCQSLARAVGGSAKSFNINGLQTPTGRDRGQTGLRRTSQKINTLF